MTIAIVALSEKGFYIVADTNSIRGGNVYTKNTQKVFFSNKHKILLCFANQGILTHKDTNNSTKLHVEYVIKTFFDQLEKLDNFKVSDITAALIKFVDDTYPDYQNYFRHQIDPDNYISYFYGGFQSGVPTIYSHHNGRDSGSMNAGYHHFFANTNAVEKSIISTLSLPDAPQGLTSKLLVTDLNWMGTFLKYTIPLAAISLNRENSCEVGNYLHMIYFENNSSDAIESYYKWEVDIDNMKETQPILRDSMPPYLMYKSSVEEKEAILNDELKAYCITDGAQASFFDDSVQTSIPSLISSTITQPATTSQLSDSSLLTSLQLSLQNIDEKDSDSGNISEEATDSSNNNINSPDATTEATSHGNINQQIDDSLEDNNDKESNASNNIAETKVNNDSIFNELINQQLSWIYQLPQWLQDQILNSTPIKTLIESIKYNSAIYEPKSAAEDFYEKVLYVYQDKSQNDVTEDATLEKAKIDDTVYHSAMIDMSMILSGTAAVGYLILPTIVESIPISGKDNFFTGEAGLNLLNGFDVF